MKDLVKRVEGLKVTMINPDEEKLNFLVSETLTYGHSNGYIENREEFIASLVSGKYRFISIDISDQDIRISGNTAVVRHNLFAVTHDRDKPEGTVKLKVLLIWQFQDNKGWVLLARQAVKNTD